MQNLAILKNKMNQKKASAKKTEPDANLIKDDSDPAIPDRSHGDLYCALCDSHMNNEAMWTAHVLGKKHLKNLKKDGGPEKKYEIIDQPSSIQRELDEIDGEAVVGLKHIDEIYRKSAAGPIFMCYLCHSNVSMGSLLIEHILSYKHRLAYVKENDPQRYHTLDNDNFSKGGLETIVHGIANELEQRFGRGFITVKKEIERSENIITWSSKRVSNPVPRPSTPSFQSYPRDVQTRSFEEFSSRSEINSASNYRRSVSPYGQQFRSASPGRYRAYPSPPRRHRERSLTPPRRYRQLSSSPPRKYRDSTPPRRYRETSPSPPRRYRDHSRSPFRRHREPSPIKKMRNRAKKSKPSEKSQKKRNTRSSSSSSSPCSSLRERLADRSAALVPQNSFSQNSLNNNTLHPEIEPNIVRRQESSPNTQSQPMFNVLHRSPVQPPAVSSSSNIFMTTGGIPTNSLPPSFFNNDSFLNNQGAANASVAKMTPRTTPWHELPDPRMSTDHNLGNSAINGAMYEHEYAPRHMRLDDIIHRNTQRSIPGLDLGYSGDDVKTMISSLSNDEFLKMVSEKLDHLPFTNESDVLLERLKYTIDYTLKSRQNMQIRQNVYAVTSMPNNSAATDLRSNETPMRNIIRNSQPLEEFIAMARMKMER